jgi:hypothetical protein
MCRDLSLDQDHSLVSCAAVASLAGLLLQVPRYEPLKRASSRDDFLQITTR